MLEAFINVPFQTVISSPTGVGSPVPLLYLGSTATGIPITCVQQGSSGVWTATFTPTATGVYTLVAFGQVQFRFISVVKSMYSFLANIEDEAIGSWQWDKVANTLTMLRQDGTTLKTFTVLDSLTMASREAS